MPISQVLLLNAGLIAAVMLLLWLLSLRLRDASIVDIFWGLGFVLIGWTTYACSSGGTRAVVLVALTTMWGLRLSAYLAWRNHGRGEDPRYGAMRRHRGDSFWWVSLFTVFGLQGAVMWIVSLPVQVGQLGPDAVAAAGYVGIAIWSIGFLFEAVGDFQLSRFKSDRRNRGQVMDGGLWRYTRHPNYFGNALVWWGISLVAVTQESIWIMISPTLMTFLLLKVSGVALLERDLASRSEAYRHYIRRTSPFIPWPPKSTS